MHNNEAFVKRLSSLEGKIFSEKILERIINKRKVLNQENYIDAGNMIVTNLRVLGERRISRGNDRFPSLPARYGLNYFTRTYILSMIDEMIEQGYIEQHLGYGDKKDYGKKTLLSPTKKLSQEIGKITLAPIKVSEVIELRAKKERRGTRGTLLDYPENRFTEEIRSSL